MAYIFVLYCGM